MHPAVSDTVAPPSRQELDRTLMMTAWGRQVGALDLFSSETGRSERWSTPGVLGRSLDAPARPGHLA